MIVTEPVRIPPENGAPLKIRRKARQKSGARTRRGEIDIIARDGGTIVFVEVKARRHGIDSSLEAVDFRKRRRIVRAALHFITTRRLDGVSFRFDVVAVTLGRAGVVRAIHLEKNAFAVDE